MKKLIAVSVLLSMVLVSAAYADTEYTSIRESQNSNVPQDWSAKSEANQQLWDQTIRSYEVNYNESYMRNWDNFTDAYQKSKRIQH